MVQQIASGLVGHLAGCWLSVLEVLQFGRGAGGRGEALSFGLVTIMLDHGVLVPEEPGGRRFDGIRPP